MQWDEINDSACMEIWEDNNNTNFWVRDFEEILSTNLPPINWPPSKEKHAKAGTVYKQEELLKCLAFTILTDNIIEDLKKCIVLQGTNK